MSIAQLSLGRWFESGSREIVFIFFFFNENSVLYCITTTIYSILIFQVSSIWQIWWTVLERTQIHDWNMAGVLASNFSVAANKELWYYYSQTFDNIGKTYKEKVLSWNANGWTL